LSHTNLLTYHHFPTKLSCECFNQPCLQYKSQPKGGDDVKNVQPKLGSNLKCHHCISKIDCKWRGTIIQTIFNCTFATTETRKIYINIYIWAI